MNVVIPMAGHGRRFVEAGWTTPKPLIPVLGKPMYSRATESLPLERATRLIFVCLQNHLDTTSLGEDILGRYRRYRPIIIATKGVTKGQASTALLAADHIDSSDPLIVFNSDTYFRSSILATLEYGAASTAGIIGVFSAGGKRWSFVRLGEDGAVLETAEKRRISDLACTGFYHFSAGRDFVKYASASIAADEKVNGEFYIAPIYNRMIADGLRITIDIADEVWPLGTPEDLDNFLSAHQNQS